MATHNATIRWFASPGEDYAKGQYSRAHSWNFDGLANVAASASPHIVPMPWANPNAVDPEEAFVASISSCHLLTYLWLASREGFQVDRYEDEAAGVMTKNERGVYWVSTVTLAPRIAYSGDKLPTPDDEARLHHAAHEQCFIANSVKTDVLVRPRGP